MKALLKLLIKPAAFVHHLSYRFISEASIRIEGGIHPKHKIMKYHDFFLDNISANDVVLDVGCGKGAVAWSISKKAKQTVGVDTNTASIQFAQKKFKRKGLSFLVADATKHDFGRGFDIIILSNVLEHIKNRVGFLKKLTLVAPKILIRVPMISRSWLPVYLKKQKIEYRLDRTHYLEYTEDVLFKEIATAGLQVDSFFVRWGEIYAVVSKK